MKCGITESKDSALEAGLTEAHEKDLRGINSNHQRLKEGLRLFFVVFLLIR